MIDSNVATSILCAMAGMLATPRPGKNASIARNRSPLRISAACPRARPPALPANAASPIDTTRKDMSAKKTPAKKPAPPPNISALARQYDVSRETIRKLRENGTDLADEAAVTNAIALSRAKLAAPSAQATDGESYTEARRRRAIADANRAEVIAKRESGSVVEIAAVRDAFASIAAELRARLMALRGDLVVEVEGLDGPGVYKVIDRRVRELLESFANRAPIPKTKP